MARKVKEFTKLEKKRIKRPGRHSKKDKNTYRGQGKPKWLEI